MFPGDDIAEFGGGVVGEAAAVGVARHVDALLIETIVFLDIFHQVSVGSRLEGIWFSGRLVVSTNIEPVSD